MYSYRVASLKCYIKQILDGIITGWHLLAISPMDSQSVTLRHVILWCNGFHLVSTLEDCPNLRYLWLLLVSNMHGFTVQLILEHLADTCCEPQCHTDLPNYIRTIPRCWLVIVFWICFRYLLRYFYIKSYRFISLTCGELICSEIDTVKNMVMLLVSLDNMYRHATMIRIVNSSTAKLI